MINTRFIQKVTIDWSKVEPYSYLRKTKAPKTTVVKTTVKPTVATTSKAKTTSKKQDVKVKATQAYAITEQSTEISSVTELSTTVITEISTVNDNNTKPIISQGKKYKIIIGVFAAVSFTLIAVASSKSSKKNN